MQFAQKRTVKAGRKKSLVAHFGATIKVQTLQQRSRGEERGKSRVAHLSAARDLKLPKIRTGAGETEYCFGRQARAVVQIERIQGRHKTEKFESTCQEQQKTGG